MIPGTIILSDQLTASNTDILQGTRLQNAPSNGLLQFRMSSTVATKGTNAYVTTLQLPNGATPINGILVPIADSGGTVGLLDDRTVMQFSFPVAQGGHVVYSVVLTGAGTLTYQVIFVPTR